MADDYSVWMRRIRAAEEERGHHAERWRAIFQEHVGRGFRKGFLAEREAVTLPLINNYIRVILPHLLPRGRHVEVEVTPRRPGPEYKESADQLADQITAILHQIRFLHQARRAIRAEFYSAGILKVGLRVRTGQVVDVESSRAPDEKVTVDLDLERAERQEYLDPDLPFVSWVKPGRFTAEVDSTGLDESRWVAHEIYMTVEALKADRRIPQHIRDRIESNCDASTRTLRAGVVDRTAGGGYRDPRLGLVRLYEVADRDPRTVLLMPADSAKGAMEIWLESPWPAGVEGHFYSMMAFEPIDEFFWPNPILGPVFDAAQGADRLETHGVEAAMAAKTVIAYDSDKLAPEQLSALEGARDQSVIGIPGLTQHVREFRFGGTHENHAQTSERLKRRADEFVGITQMERGIAGASPSPSATEVQAAMAMAGVRMDDLKGCTADFLGDAVAKLAGIYVAHIDMFAGRELIHPSDKRVIALGPGVAGEYLDYLFEINTGSVERVDPAIRQKRRAEAMQMSFDPNVAQKLAAEGFALRSQPLIDEYLRRDLDYRNPERFLVQLNQAAGPDPVAKAGEEDREMIRTGEPAPVDPADQHQAELAVHAADYEQSRMEAIALHMMRHLQYLEVSGAAGAGRAQVGSAGRPNPMAEAGAAQVGNLRAQAVV